MSEAIKRYNTYVQAFLLTVAGVGGLVTLATGLFVFLSEWRNFPSKVEANTEQLQLLQEQIAAFENRTGDFNVIDILPSGISVLTQEVVAGEPIWVAFWSRANIDCERHIRIQFLNEQDRSFHFEERTDRAVKSAVSDDFQLLIIPIRTFESMSPGTYRYAPTVEPIDCGVYRAQQLPLSERFTVIANDTGTTSTD